MSIQVNEFHHVEGQNDAEYIELLKKELEAQKRLTSKAIDKLRKPEQGEWIYGEHDVAMCDGYRCDKCGFFVPWDYKYKFIDFIKDYHYCPNCGAVMKGADDV